MRRRFLPPMVAAIILISCGFAAGRSAIGIRAAIHNCQNPDLAPDSRIEACSEAIHSNLVAHPVLASFYYNRGVAYEAAHDIDHARQDYDKALELKPDFPKAQANRARLSDPAAAVPQPAEVK
jgi:lipoprotein NlpI